MAGEMGNLCFQQRVILRGTVEGVGMRPTLYRFARTLGLGGWVRNRSREVELLWQGSEELLCRARHELAGALPPGSRIEEVLFGELESVNEAFSEFTILNSARPASGGRVNLLTPPDLAPCPECLAELHSSGDRRYRYAFNSCGCCGPRATVIESLPYDRAVTAWRDFPLCPECRSEYDDPATRRFHIEGISCPLCGPKLELLDASGESLALGDEALLQAAASLNQGKILALKGVGGFQLLVDPRNRRAVELLRLRKRRPAKPLALMAANLASADAHFALSPDAREFLCSPAAPILLAPWKPSGRNFHPELLAPDRPEEAGVMLPASPLHTLLMDAFGGELLVATSGNASGAPPALSVEEAVRDLGVVTDFILTHERHILWRHDDSLGVVNAGRLQLWRRARGFGWALACPAEIRRPILALGGAQKNAFAAAGRDCLLLSPHHGELANADTADEWEDAVRRTVAQLAEPPECIAVDLHPDYYSTVCGEKLAAEWNLPLLRVQHHHAHALAGMYEFRLSSALALVFDGTGMGSDGTLWGAELFHVDREQGIRRLASFAPVPLPGGEAAIRDCRRQWQGRRWAAGLKADQMIELQCEAKLNTPYTTSAGRLFDAFAAAIGVAPKTISYEGQAAIRLEAAAWREPKNIICPFPWNTDMDGDLLRIDWAPLWHDDFTRHVSPARDFHHTVAEAALAMLARGFQCAGVLPVILSGGVMQNRFLSALLVETLQSQGRRVLLPQQIPPNDGGIAIGQILADGWVGGGGVALSAGSC